MPYLPNGTFAESKEEYKVRVGLALDAFVASASALTAAHFERNFKSLTPPTFHYEAGPRYARIVRADANGGQASVHCFVRLSDGAVMKAAGWKAPFIAKGGPDCPATVRGNIFASDGGQDCLTVYGVKDAR